MLSFFEITEGVDLSRRLEFMGRDNSLEEAGPTVEALALVNERVLTAIATIRESCQATSGK